MEPLWTPYSRCEFTQAARQACTRDQAWEAEREIERDGWRREREGWRTERESLERGKRVLQQRVADLLEVRTAATTAASTCATRRRLLLALLDELATLIPC